MRPCTVGLIICLATTSCAALAEDATAPSNIVPNPSFEEMAEGKVTGWTISDKMSSWSTEQARDGARSLKVEDTSKTDGSNVASDLFPVEPGQVYTMTAFARSETGQGISLYARFHDATRKEIRAEPPLTLELTSPGRWRQRARVVTAPANAAFMSLWIHSYSDAVVTAYIDAISVTQGANAGAPKTAALKPFTPVPIQFTTADAPVIYLTREEIDGLRRRAETLPWAKNLLTHFLAAARRDLEKPLAIPERGGGWYHHYACPKDGTSLKTQSPTDHLCPKCNTVYHGDPYDAVAVMGQHGGLARQARDLGLAFQLTGEKPFAERVKAILLGYADRYASYPLHDVWGKQDSKKASCGRVGPQTLDESSWLIPITQGYDLVRTSGTLSDDEKQHIETDLLRAAAAVIARNNGGIGNWQSWHNAAMGAVAFCLKDRDLAEKVVNGPSGFLFQMANSVTEDGFWYEGSWGYHYYALSAHLELTEMAFRAGIDLYRDDAPYKSMFDTSLRFMAPNRKLPAFHDAHLCDALGGAKYYEVAFRRWGDPIFAWCVNQRQRGQDAFLFGADEVPASAGMNLASCVFPGVGWMILRGGTGADAMYLAMDYGPHGGGHGHPDKLGFTFYALGDFVAHDPGCLAYAVPLHGEWYRQTVAHNTVVVDQAPQDECTGALQFSTSGPMFRAGAASADAANAPVAMSRLALMSDDYLILVDTLSDTQKHVYDWAYHGQGEFATPVPLVNSDAPIAAGYGYQRIENVRRGPVDAMWSAAWKTKGGEMRLQMLDDPGTELITGAGWGPSASRTASILVRRNADKTRYMALLEPRPAAVTDETRFERLPVEGDATAWGLRVQNARGEDRIISGAAQTVKTAGDLVTDARLAVISAGAKPFVHVYDGTHLTAPTWNVRVSGGTCFSAGRPEQGQYLVGNEGATPLQVTLGGEVVAGDIGAGAPPACWVVDRTFARGAVVPVACQNGTLAFALPQQSTCELSFPGARSVADRVAAETLAAEEAARRARLPTLPNFPIAPAPVPPAEFVNPAVPPVVIQAEAFTAQGGGNVTVATDKVGCKDACFRNWDNGGHWLEWTVELPATAWYQVSLRYCTASTEALRAVLIDGAYPTEACRTVALPGTGGFSNATDDWKELALADCKTGEPLRFFLPQGRHTLRVYNLLEPVNLDSITFVAAVPPPK
ncbi:MAG: hypothetical protein A3K19_22425 [Lentisphaerae bacterium RIFOXYB12_FULL_65_16]|nr:MAG: hypothetical protein A3K18_09845 [Lentisphaerae bacterium RIFOXYA12_64_32]OGV91853.1 MAG: hypothetical protein A3K19_22425 [Lentisphaerae bacterium RIFOXYB12_FULL_65_16]